MNLIAETNASSEPQETPEGDGAGAAANSPPSQNSPQDLKGTVSNAAGPHQTHPPVTGAAPATPTPTAAPTPLLPNLSDRCLALHKMFPHIEGLFLGDSKRAGKARSREDCDERYVAKLINKKVVEEEELAAALMARPLPHPHAPARDEKYARGLVQKALQERKALDAKAASDNELSGEWEEGLLKKARESIDFTVDAARVFKSDESRFELLIEGKWLVLDADQLRNAKQFQVVFFNTLLRLPRMPPTGKGNVVRGWEMLVNEWIEEAEKLQLPGNATDEEVLQRTVDKMKNAIPEGKDAASLYDDMAFVENGIRYFTLDAVFDRVRQSEHDVRPRDIALMLERIGCTEHKGFDSGGHIIPAWSEPVALPKSDTTSATPVPAPGCTPSASADASPAIAGEVLP